MARLKKALESAIIFIVIIICFSFFGSPTGVAKSSSLEEFTDKVLAMYKEYNTDTTGYKQEIALDDLDKVGEDYMISSTLLSSRLGIDVEVDGEISNGNVIRLSGSNRARLTEEVVYLKSGDIVYRGGEKLLAIDSISEALGYEVVFTHDSVELIRPFFTKRLYLKTTAQIDDMGAVATISGYDDTVVLQYATEEAAERAFLQFGQNPDIEYVDIDFIVEIENTEATAVSGSTYSYTSWGGDAMGVGSYTENLVASVAAKGKSLKPSIAAVLDTGIDSDHSWFRNRIASGGKDYTGTATSSTTPYEDDNSHGTHVSGIICDLTEDNVSILPLKVLNAEGKGYSLGITNAMKHVLQLVKDGTNVTVMNMSLGGTHSIGDSTWNSYNDVVTQLNSYGVPTIAAAGNEGVDVSTVSPANVNSAITVSAVGYENGSYFRPSWSNYGSYVDVTAPGVDIISAYMGGGLAYMSGTSMAAPHVAAAVALIKSDPDISYSFAEIELLFDNNAIDLGNSGWDIYYGEGLVSLEYAYANLLSSNVVFSRTEKNCQESFDLTLSIAESDAKIYYTLDGSVPNKNNGMLYTGPITISTTTVVKAVAFVFDSIGNIAKYSKVSSMTYSFGSADVSTSYIVDNNGVLTGYRGVLKELTIPSIVNGITVKEIGTGAFTDTTVQTVVLPSTVTVIQKEAFASCTTLTSVVGPSVITIGDSAFEGCTKLGFVTDTEYPELTQIGSYAFAGCFGLMDIKLAKVESVGDCAFYMSNPTQPVALNSVELPAVTSLGSYAFYGCGYLNSVKLSILESVPSYAFAYANIKNLSLPKATLLGSFAFYHNTSMQTLELPSVEFIGMSCFDYDTSDTTVVAANELMSIILPKVQYLGVYAFCDSKTLTAVTAPKLEYIGRQAFDGCVKLTNISTDRLRVIGEEAFMNCSSLEAIDLPLVKEIRARAFFATILQRISISNAVQYIGDSALRVVNTANLLVQIYRGSMVALEFVEKYGYVYSFLDGEYTYLTYQTISGETIKISGINPYVETPSEVVIPERLGAQNLPVTEIGDGAFKNCTNITSLVSSTIEIVGSEAFYQCQNLSYVSFENVKTIKSLAFYRCEVLDKVEIPFVENVEMRAFYGCNSLDSVTLDSEISNIGAEAFGYGSNGVVNPNFMIMYDGTTMSSVVSNYAEAYNVPYVLRFGSVGTLWYRTITKGSTVTAEIAKIDRNKQGSIVLPGTINGYTTTSIGEDAFADCAFITGVYMPATVKNIGAGAFEGCTALEDINLHHVETIGANAFRFCTSLQEVEMNTVTSVSNYAFYGCVDLEWLSMPNVTTVGVSAFAYCENLQVVSCPKLTSVSEYSFFGDSRLYSIDTKMLSQIGSSASTQYAFGMCYSLKSVYLPNVINIAPNSFNNSGVEKLVIGRSFAPFTSSTYKMDTDIDIYGYINSTAQSYAQSNGNDFYPIDDLAYALNLPANKSCIQGSSITLQVEVLGYEVSYCWYKTNNTSATTKEWISGEYTNQITLQFEETGNYYYFVEVMDWKQTILRSNVCNVNVVAQNTNYSIDARNGDKYTVSISGIQTFPIVVAAGQTVDVMVTILPTIGYSLNIVYIQGDKGDLIEINLLDGQEYCGLYMFWPLQDIPITQNYIISATTFARSDTEYTVKHYKEVLEPSSASVQKDGLFFELADTEICVGTTDARTNAQANAYDGYTALSYNQKTVLGDDSQIIEIFYTRNYYTLALTKDSGIETVTGNGRYKFGTTVNISATLAVGYNWARWTSNSSAVPDMLENNATLVMPMADTTLIATSAIKTFIISVTADEGCVISPNDLPKTVEFGSSHTVTFGAVANYKISSIVLNGTPINITANYRIRSIDKDYNFVVTSEKKKVVVTIETNIVGLSDSASIEIGSPFVYEVPTKEGYDIHSVYVNGSAVEMVDGKVEFEVVSEDIEIEVLYSEIRNPAGETPPSVDTPVNPPAQEESSTTSDTTKEDEKNNLSPVIIAGVILGVLFVITIIAVAAKMISRSKRL
ncbi:MAG: hypothetical protein E7354_05725 [Clostridiales bacterium]|nr:hypothetical protein [Clostridiales bacterium]